MMQEEEEEEEAHTHVSGGRRRSQVHYGGRFNVVLCGTNSTRSKFLLFLLFFLQKS